MRTFDFAPLHRATIGFDQIADMMDRVLTNDVAQPSYPPYNIEKTADNAYRIAIAVAGFADDELEVEVHNQTLRVSGKKVTAKDEAEYLHRGIATRNFERRFELADHVVVQGADISNGLLNIDLVREVPEALKPRRIDISNNAPEVQTISA